MNTTGAHPIYDLLPAVYRRQDVAQGRVLDALLGVIGEQVDIVEGDIDRLYENWFIETCDPWVVPYIADLVGNRLTEVVSRRDVANTIRNRRRKGTVLLLETLARDVADWPARAVEFFKLVAQTQTLQSLSLSRGRWADLRAMDQLDRLGGPFEAIAHNVDVRRINSRHTPGRFNLPSVGLFVWRIKSYRSTLHAAYRLQKKQAGTCYTFHPLGLDTPLHVKTEDSLRDTTAAEINIQVAIRRRSFAADPARFYGLDKSLQIWTGETPDRRKLVPVDEIVEADLSDWEYPAHQLSSASSAATAQQQAAPIAVDPELGRMMAPRSRLRKRIWATFHYGFLTELGGGEYRRKLRQPLCTPIYRVFLGATGRDHEYATIEAAIEAWNKAIENKLEPPRAVIELVENRVFPRLRIQLKDGRELQIRAASGVRPIVKGVIWDARRVDPSGCRLVLDGLVVVNRFRISGRRRPAGSENDASRPAELVVRHCTLPPRYASHQGSRNEAADAAAKRHTELWLQNFPARIVIDKSILGTIRVEKEEARTEPCELTITNSIVDGQAGGWAIRGSDSGGDPPCRPAHVQAVIRRSTLLGKVNLHEMKLAEDSIFTSLLRVARTQTGCVRLCYLPHGSVTPSRFECQPDLVQRQLAQRLQRVGQTPTADQLEAERHRVVPRFTSLHYGDPGYCQLAETTAPEIQRGSSEDAELGAFHDLYQPQREAGLRLKLAEYTPAEKNVGIIFAS